MKNTIPKSPIVITAITQTGPDEAIATSKKMAEAGQISCYLRHVGHEGDVAIINPLGHVFKAPEQIKAEPVAGVFTIGQLVMHCKSGNRYIIVLDRSSRLTLESSEDPAYAYSSADEEKGRLWVRSAAEMEDGRFVAVSGSQEVKTARPGDRLDECRRTDPVVNRLMRAGASLEDIVVVLSDLRADLMKRVMTLEAIAPKCVKTPDGKVYTWQCPDSLVPIRVVEPGNEETPGTVEPPESVGRQPVKCSCGAETTLTLLRSVAASTTPARYWAADDPAWRFRTGLGWSCGADAEHHQAPHDWHVAKHVKKELRQTQKDLLEAFSKASGIVFVARKKTQENPDNRGYY